MTTAGEAIAAFDRLAMADVDAILGGAKAMILAPHPDDESLGCGGLIAECCRRGNPPLVVILTDGAASHPGSADYPPDRLALIRAAEAHAAVACLDLPAENLRLLGQPDGALPSAGAVVERVAAMMHNHGCGVIVAPWRGDPHCDHEAAAAIGRAVAAATGVRLISYPVWGWLLPPDRDVPIGEVAGWRLDIAAHLAAKHDAIAAHASQHGDLITDSPAGFRLPRGLLATFERPFEVFLAE